MRATSRPQGPVAAGSAADAGAARTAVPSVPAVPAVPAVSPSRRPAVGLLRREQLVGALALWGGLMMMAGSFLPWLSFYAGLYPMRGVTGAWGRLLALGGVLCLAAGVAVWRRRAGAARLVLLLAGGLGAFTLWLLWQLGRTWRDLQANPMLVPRLGPGLFVVLAGTLVALAAGLAGVHRRT